MTIDQALAALNYALTQGANGSTLIKKEDLSEINSLTLIRPDVDLVAENSGSVYVKAN